ncbi:MAG: PIG-L family deacetylase [Acidobacteriota bacterium]
MSTNSNRTLFFSFAHPDDETFLVAGTACKYGSQGVNLVLSTATLGQAGKRGEPPVCSVEELPAVREKELRLAAQVLGIHHLRVLGFQDRRLADVPPDEIRRQLVHQLRSYRPQVVITFDPDGSNLHPDHIAISRFTADAVAAAADSRWLPEAGEGHEVQRLIWTAPVRIYEITRYADLAALPGVDFIIDTQAWWQRKVEALRAHRSQHLSLDRHFLKKPDLQQLASREIFRQAWGPPLKRRPSEDLFENIC